MLFQDSREKGQSLLEVTITLGIALVLIIALTITTIQGLQTSQLSQNQIQATKFAQEGLERVRILRNNNIVVPIGTNSCSWYADSSNTPLIWSSSEICSCPPPPPNTPPPCTFKYDVTPDNKGIYHLLDTPNLVSSVDEVIGIFKRKILIEDIDANRKKFTSVVTWIDQSGSHESHLETILSNY